MAFRLGAPGRNLTLPLWSKDLDRMCFGRPIQAAGDEVTYHEPKNP